MDYTNSYMPHPAEYPQDFGSGPAEHQYQQHYEQASSSDQHGNPYVTQGVPQHITCDIKPRLTKEQHDILETHFQSQPKPNTSTKKGFAESLNVSLDKVNNWFQNRRAKSKQDAKKQTGALHILNAHHSTHHFNMSGSDSEPSPAFSSPDYFNMMQQCTADDSHANAHGLAQYSAPFEEQDQFPVEMSYSGSSDDQFQNFGFEHATDMFDSPQDLNRRTLTQEQFDALSHQQGVPHSSGGFNAYGIDPETYKLFTGFSQDEIKPQEAFAFPTHVGMPMHSHDSSVLSTTSEQSNISFPSSHAMQENNASSASSEWTGSRSSSISNLSRDDQFVQPIVAPQPQQLIQTSRWQPGQSVPVDPNQLSREFEQVRHARQSSQHFQTEHPLAWPNDDAFHQQQQRSESQTRMITHSMGNVGIHTPQPQQNADFKSPAPASSLASRRQRARPAPLGLASMRSQSYSGAPQPGSPGHLQQQPHLAPGHQIRRIKSSNVVGGVVQGRIQKQLPGSAQRSPLNWTFSDSANSPKALRHVSSQSGSNLAPPTPMSPKPEQQRQAHQWQNSYGHITRQASISESDLEQGVPYVPSGSAPPQQSFSSPPHTPLYPPQPQFAQQWVGGNAITENTPPQSAPASQQCFPTHNFAPPPQPVHHQPPPVPQPPPPQPQKAMQHMFSVQPEPHRPPPPEPHMQMVNMSMPPQPQFTITSSAPMEMPMHWPAGGIPIVDANGQIQLAVPHPHYQYLQHPLTQPPPPQQMGQYPFSASTSPGLQVTSQVPRQPPQQPQPEFFVHEYHPPEDVKRAATPRKTPVDTTPKNYTFANQGPEHFEKGKKADKASATPDSSPASTSAGTAGS